MKTLNDFEEVKRGSTLKHQFNLISQDHCFSPIIHTILQFFTFILLVYLFVRQFNITYLNEKKTQLNLKISM